MSDSHNDDPYAPPDPERFRPAMEPDAPQVPPNQSMAPATPEASGARPWSPSR